MVKLTDLQFNPDGSLIVDEEGKAVMNDNSSLAARTATSALNAATAGFGDEILDAAGATDAADTVRSNQERLAEENPILNFGAQAAGFLVPGSAVARSVGLGTKGLSVGQNILRGGAAGAIEGAAAGAGFADGETALERLDDAAIGGALGAGLGGALSGLGASARNLFANRTQAAQRNAAEFAADSLGGITPASLLQRLRNGDSIERIALDQADGDTVTARNMITEITSLDDGRIARVLGQAASRRQAQVSANLAAEAGELSENLTYAGRTSVDDINPNTNADRLSQARNTAGENLGTARQATAVNSTEIVDEIISNPEFGVAARNAMTAVIKDIGELQSSRQITSEAGDKVGEFVVLSRDAAEEAGLDSAGIYARVGAGDDVAYEAAELNADVFATIAQRVRQRGSDLLDNSADDASSNTALGASLVNASDEITNIVNRNAPELSGLNRDFIGVDAEQRIVGLVNSAFRNGTAADGANVRQKLSQIRNGTNTVVDEIDGPVRVPNISEDSLVQGLRAGVREQLQIGKVLDFDETSSQYQFLKEAYESANKGDEFLTLTREINSRNAVIEAVEQLNRSTTKSTDPVEIGNALQRVFNSKTMSDAIDELPAENAATYRAVMSEMLDELKLLKSTTGLATSRITPDTGFVNSFLGHAMFAGVVFNTIGKIFAVSSLRAARDSGGLRRLSTRKDFGLGQEQLANLVGGDQGVLTNALLDEFDQAIVSGNKEGVFARALRNAATFNAAQGGEQAQVEETSSTDGPPPFNQSSTGNPFGGGTTSTPNGPPNFGSSDSGSPFN